jgi:hypothetical protein
MLWAIPCFSTMIRAQTSTAYPNMTFRYRRSDTILRLSKEMDGVFCFMNKKEKFIVQTFKPYKNENLVHL